MKVGERIIQLREAANISTAELARRSKVSQPYLYQLEAGTRKGSIDIIEKISRALNMTIKDFFDGYETRDLPQQLKDIGIENITLAKEIKDSGIPVEDLRKIIKALKAVE